MKQIKFMLFSNYFNRDFFFLGRAQSSQFLVMVVIGIN